jgi:hypothetical protein
MGCKEAAFGDTAQKQNRRFTPCGMDRCLEPRRSQTQNHDIVFNGFHRILLCKVKLLSKGRSYHNRNKTDGCHLRHFLMPMDIFVQMD